MKILKALDPSLILLLLIFATLAALSPVQGQVSQTLIVSDGGTVYYCHQLTADEIRQFRNLYGVMDPANSYNLVINGHGTGLAPPDEEGWYSLTGSIAIDYAMPAGPYPSSRRLDLDPYFPAIGDQGSQGSCAAWASVYYANTYLQARAHGWTDVRSNPGHVMSPAWTYNKVNGGSDGGSWCDKNMQLVSEIGSASLATMPYVQSDWLSWGGEGAWKEAPLYRAGGYATVRPDNIDAIKALLNDGYLVTFYIDASCPWYSSIDTVLTYGEYTGGKPNHANVIVGYDDSVSDGADRGAFRVANSWGSDFKDGGFYWITYRAMEKISSNSPIANSYLPKGGGVPYEPLVLATWRLDPAGSLDGATLRVGVGSPESPAASKTPSDYWIAGKSSKIPNFMCVDLTELRPYIDSGNGEFFLTIGKGSVASKVTSFEIEVYSSYASPPVKVYSSSEVPVWAPVTIAITDRPSVVFSWSPFSPLTFEQVKFTDLSSSKNGTIVSRYWSFGDGSYSNLANPSHTYSSHGLYTVSLTVLDSNGLSATRSQGISVRNRPPEVELLSPRGGGLFSGILDLAAKASDMDDGVQKVDFFYVAGGQVYFIGSNRTVANDGLWTFQWNTSLLTISGVQVYAVAFDGYEYSEKGYSDMTIDLDNTPPSQPSPRYPREGSRIDELAMLSWGQSTDLGSGISGYQVEILASGGSAEPIEIRTASTSCQVELPTGMWTWRVRAFDLAGNYGEWSPASSFITDSFLVNESGPLSTRSDVGSVQKAWFRVYYAYDGTPFTPDNGSVYINGSQADWNQSLQRWELPVSFPLTGEACLLVSAVRDTLNPVTKLNISVSPASLIFDRVIIDRIDPAEIRIQAGREVEFMASGHYEYDSADWVGGFVLNDSTVKQSPGIYTYSIVRITDELHNLTAFAQLCPPAAVTFDTILFDEEHSASIPGGCEVRLRLVYGTDSSPVTGALVTINGQPAEELGGGIYALSIRTMMPYLSIRSETSIRNFDAIVRDEGVLMTGNVSVYLTAISAFLVSITLYARRRSRRS